MLLRFGIRTVASIQSRLGFAAVNQFFVKRLADCLELVGQRHGWLPDAVPPHV
jgi:hypothetical protein